MAAARPWAVLLAATAHLAVLAWLVVTLDADSSGAVATGSGGIEVSLGPAGSNAGTATPADLPELRPVQAVHEVATAAATPVEATETVATVTATPPAATETQPHQPAVATATAPPLITATAAAESQVSAAPPTTTAKPARTTPAAKPRPPQPTPPPVAAAAAPAGTAAGRSGAEQAPGAGSGDASAGGGQQGVNQDYLSRLAAWLEQHKAYPRRAQQRREEGTVLLRFAIDRAGRVLDWRIVRGSGHDALDQEVAAMIRRAEPMPPMPPEMPQPRIELTVPVQFRLS